MPWSSGIIPQQNPEKKKRHVFHVKDYLCHYNLSLWKKKYVYILEMRTSRK